MVTGATYTSRGSNVTIGFIFFIILFWIRFDVVVRRTIRYSIRFDNAIVLPPTGRAGYCVGRPASVGSALRGRRWTILWSRYVIFSNTVLRVNIGIDVPCFNTRLILENIRNNTPWVLWWHESIRTDNIFFMFFDFVFNKASANHASERARRSVSYGRHP